MTSTIGSLREISNGITAFGHHSITGGCSRSQSSCAVSPCDPLLDLPPHVAPPPGGSACAGRYMTAIVSSHDAG